MALARAGKAFAGFGQMPALCPQGSGDAGGGGSPGGTGYEGREAGI